MSIKFLVDKNKLNSFDDFIISNFCQLVLKPLCKQDTHVIIKNDDSTENDIFDVSVRLNNSGQYVIITKSDSNWYINNNNGKTELNVTGYLKKYFMDNEMEFECCTADANYLKSVDQTLSSWNLTISKFNSDNIITFQNVIETKTLIPIILKNCDIDFSKYFVNIDTVAKIIYYADFWLNSSMYDIRFLPSSVSGFEQLMANDNNNKERRIKNYSYLARTYFTYCVDNNLPFHNCTHSFLLHNLINRDQLSSMVTWLLERNLLPYHIFKDTMFLKILFAYVGNFHQNFPGEKEKIVSFKTFFDNLIDKYPNKIVTGMLCLLKCPNRQVLKNLYNESKINATVYEFISEINEDFWIMINSYENISTWDLLSSNLEKMLSTDCNIKTDLFIYQKVDI